jgi:hypothetical protein
LQRVGKNGGFAKGWKAAMLLMDAAGSKTEDSVTLTQLVLLVVGSTSLLFLVRIFHCGPAGSLLYHSIHSLASIDLIIYAT